VQSLRAAVHAQSSKQTPEVNLDGVLADGELIGNVFIAQALVQHQNQLLLSLRQFGGRSHRALGCSFFLGRRKESAQALYDGIGWAGFF